MRKIDQASNHENSQIQTSPYQKNIRLEFFNISYYVNSSAKYKLQSCKVWHEQRKILSDISGVVEPGDLVALMGSSGAGKSTLLNILSRRIISNKGKILLNGVEADINPVLKASSCYVQQEDLFFAYNTVSEHLEQQAALRLDLPLEQRKQRIDSIMQRFSLTKIRDSIIGDIAQGTRRGISGGEKKRLSLATELLINPKLIFADEPTSGLDAFMAYSVTEILKSLTDMKHTVVTTIHQPSSDVFSLFNKLLLLAEGKLIFYGPRLAAIAYFLKLGYPCPPYTNSADHFIELVSIDWENPASKLAEIERWAQTWKQYSKSFLYEWETELKDKFTATLANETCTSESPQHMLSGSYVASNDEELITAAYDKNGNIRKPSWITVASTLLRRTFNSSARNPSIMRARLIQTVFTAFLSGLVYFRLSQTSNHSKSGACFFILVNLGFMMTFGAITTFMTDKTIVLRERDAGLYSLATYFWMKITSDFVFQFYLPIVYACVSWYMMGINDEFWRFLVATGFILLMSLSVCSIGYVVASFSKSLGVAIALGPVLLLPFLMVSGFVIQKASLPSFWLWLYHISPFVYGFSGLMRAAFLDVTFDDIKPAKNLSTAQAALMYQSGNELLEYFSIQTTQQRWFVDILVLLAWTFLGRLLAMILFIISNQRRQ